MAMGHVGCDMETTGEREGLLKNSRVQKRCEVRCKMEQKGKQEIRVEMGERVAGTWNSWKGGGSCLHNGN